jgi:hypothetical protein
VPHNAVRAADTRSPRENYHSNPHCMINEGASAEASSPYRWPAFTDRAPDRRGTGSLKWTKYGPGILPMWVADMDFLAAKPVMETLRVSPYSGDGRGAYHRPRVRVCALSMRVS